MKDTAKDLTRCNGWQFQKVHCKGYMRKVNDGRYIQILNGNETEDGERHYLFVDTRNNTSTDAIPDGDLTFEKTYYRHVEKEFVGIVVGMKLLTINGWLWVDTNTAYDGREYEEVGKEPKERKKCLLVYYGCNKSRWVPFEDAEIMEE